MGSSQDPEMRQLFLSPMIKCKIEKPFSLYLLIIFAQVTPCLHAHICVSWALPESPTLSYPKTDRSRSAWRKCERLRQGSNSSLLHAHQQGWAASRKRCWRCIYPASIKTQLPATVRRDLRQSARDWNTVRSQADHGSHVLCILIALCCCVCF